MILSIYYVQGNVLLISREDQNLVRPKDSVPAVQESWPSGPVDDLASDSVKHNAARPVLSRINGIGALGDQLSVNHRERG